jgi:prephenate dehydrogenase
VKVGVVGLGLIGGSLLKALGGVGYDRDPAVRAAAAADHEVVDELGGLAGCDLVFVAVPPAATAPAVREALAVAPVVADTASVKTPVTTAIADQRFVAAHPLAGAESAGWAAASPAVLRGAPWAVCSGSAQALCAVSDAVDRLDGHLVPCTAADHDAAVARTSHVPHVVAQALAATVSGDPLRAALTGGSYRDMTRVAGADPQLWGDILLANRDAVLAALDALAEQLAAHRQALAAGDPATAWRAPAAPAPPDWRAARGGWDAMVDRRVRRLRADGDALAFELATPIGGRP